MLSEAKVTLMGIVEKNIIVNATATRESGALTILNQFIEHIQTDKSDQYYVFVDQNYKIIRDHERIEYIFVNTVSWWKRILWDVYGLKKWLKSNNIKPNLIISLQNIGIKMKSVPQLIYYHQPFPLSSYKWSLFRKDERIFFLYKYIYPYFVALYLHKQTHIVVQIPSIRKAFISKFKVSPGNVHVIPPDITNIDNSQFPVIDSNSDLIQFIFPATPFIYKNHICLINSLNDLRTVRPDLIKKIRIHFTFEKKNGIKLYHCIQQYGLEENFIFEGVIPHGELLGMYRSMRALLFPSIIETFGLPLIEAASAGIPVLVSDLPYARDVLNNYVGASFVKYNDISEWTYHIIRLCENKHIYPSFQYGQKISNWNSFFQLVDNLKI